ncbi:MAG TPA: hypothetical protein VLR52_05760, partial [Bacteroidales bacterium]|nr:hypothetical protein [Bacteroidales bacterium]
MKTRILPIMITLICLALLGIIGVQFFWIRNAIRVSEEQFDRSVNDALAMTVSKLETHGDIMYMRKNMMGDSILELVQAFSTDTILSLNTKLDSLLKKDEFPLPLMPPLPPPYMPGNFFLEYNFPNLDSIFENSRHPGLIQPDESGNFSLEWNATIDFEKIDSLMKKQYEKELKKNKNRKAPPPGPMSEISPDESNLRIRNHTYVMDDEFMPGHDPRRARDDMRKITRKARKIKDVIQKMALELESKPQSLSQRIDTGNIQRTLRKSLNDKGINIPFEFAIQSSSDSVILPIKSKGFDTSHLTTRHRVSLFPNDIFQQHDALLVYFPEQKSFIAKSVSLITSGSVFFT